VFVFSVVGSSSMRISRRRFWSVQPGRHGRFGLLLGVAVLVTLVAMISAQAREATVRGAEMNRFGRIVFDFDQTTKLSVRVSNNILIISFQQPVVLRGERLAAELPSYVSMLRRDPDGTGLRIALTNPFQPNVLEAGEQVFIDLLPQDWTGLPPGLPQEVVSELARRAREAEAKVRDDRSREQAEPAKPIVVRVAQLPTLMRAVFVPPRVVPVSFKAAGSDVELKFDGALTLDTAQLRGRLAPAVRGISARPDNGVLLVKLSLEPGYEARGFREDETFVVDIAKPDSAKPDSAKPDSAKPDSAKAAKAGAAASQQTGKDAASARDVPDSADASLLLPELPVPGAASRPRPQSAKPADRGSPAPAARPLERVNPAQPAKPVEHVSPAQPAKPAESISLGQADATSAVVRPTATTAADGLKIVFPFPTRTAAAAFERDGLVSAVFHTPATIDLSSLPDQALAFMRRAEIRREGAVAILQFALVQPQLVRLSPQDNGWVLSIGDNGLATTLPLATARMIDGDGQRIAKVSLPEATGVHWFEDRDSGERLAVVTAFGPSRGAPKPQRFSEFRILQSAHGLAIAADADDVYVRFDPEEVTIARPLGLAVSLPSMSPDAGLGLRQPSHPAIVREEWLAHQNGDMRERHRELNRKVVEAEAADVSRARIDLARFLVAAGLNAEAGGLLSYAVDQDPALLRQNHVLLLRAIAAARMHRTAEARKVLAADILAEDPEGILWRAVVDAQDKRWQHALAGFRRSNLVLDLYPHDLQAPIRLLAARAAMEQQDHGFAENELAALGEFAAETYSAREADLLKAELDEAAGRGPAAAKVYRKLASDAERPVAAAATLRWVALALRDGSMQRDEAIERLETLFFIWRRDDVEIEAIAQLGRLYAEAGRWRDAFAMGRRANWLFPDHDVTRALHEETGRLFEDVFLAGKGDSLSKIDALALYFDFKEFTPIGRRGDEIVRRLADRLVELDLLDQASELLQHQVDQRLTGAARATVAARLATVRLMDNKPAQALAALHSTRLPELPAPLRRARTLLEARALSDLSRTDLALDVLQGETGPEIARLRADIFWNGRRWREAGEAHEFLVGTRWQGREPLSNQDRVDVVRAAVAYSLGEEKLALDRLRSKFAVKMADSADARTFAFLTRPDIANTRSFREIARSVTSADTLADFLAEYRKRYPDAAAAERRRRAPEQAAPGDHSVKPHAQNTSQRGATPNG
jgi:hypothetical protein